MLVSRLGVMFGAIVGGLLGAVVSAPFLLVIGEALMYFLAFGTISLLSSLSAFWIGEVLIPGKGRLFVITFISQATGVAVALANLVFLYAASDQLLIRITLIQQVAVGVSAIAIAAGVATISFRRAVENDPALGRRSFGDLGRTACLLFLAVVFWVGASQRHAEGLILPHAGLRASGFRHQEIQSLTE